MFGFCLELIPPISIYERLFEEESGAGEPLRPFPLISDLGVIIIVVNNAATVADLITACQRVRAAGSFVFHVDH